jgi:hypothetical protein
VSTTTGDRCVDDVSLHHPRVVRHHREPRQVHDVDTERQRRTLTFSGSLVQALLGDDDGGTVSARARRRQAAPDDDPADPGAHAHRTEEPTR